MPLTLQQHDRGAQSQFDHLSGRQRRSGHFQHGQRRPTAVAGRHGDQAVQQQAMIALLQAAAWLALAEDFGQQGGACVAEIAGATLKTHQMLA